jgi:hypothetical protein
MTKSPSATITPSSYLKVGGQAPHDGERALAAGCEVHTELDLRRKY